METRFVTIDPHHIEEEKLQAAADLIVSGELVAFPTETVYGLGADALCPKAAQKIYAAKGRPSDNPLIVHIGKLSDLERLTDEVSQQARQLAKAFWPGPFTMIVKKKAEVPYETTGGMDTVAVRMPNHPIALGLIKKSGCMLAAPSANLSGKPSPTEASHVFFDLAGRIPMILDGGMVGIGIESTILDLTEEPPMILRPGYITKEMIEDVLGYEVSEDATLMGEDSSKKPKAPGMKYRHYAPKAELVLVEGEPEDVVEKINALTTEKQAFGKRVGVIAGEETKEGYRADVVISIGARTDEDAIARHLYKLLREMDEQDVDVIYSESFASLRIGQAIMNRLLKAAGHQVMHIKKEKEEGSNERI